MRTTAIAETPPDTVSLLGAHLAAQLALVLEQQLLGWQKGAPPRSGQHYGFALTLLLSGFSLPPNPTVPSFSCNSSPYMQLLGCLTLHRSPYREPQQCRLRHRSGCSLVICQFPAPSSCVDIIYVCTLSHAIKPVLCPEPRTRFAVWFFSAHLSEGSFPYPLL